MRFFMIGMGIAYRIFEQESLIASALMEECGC